MSARSNLGVLRRLAWLAGQACACGSTDRLQVQYPPGIDNSVLWRLAEAKRGPLLARLGVRCFACHYEALCARRGVKRAAHGTRSMYRRGCRCQACHEAETAFKRQAYVPVAIRRARAGTP